MAKALPKVPQPRLADTPIHDLAGLFTAVPPELLACCAPRIQGRTPQEIVADIDAWVEEERTWFWQMPGWEEAWRSRQHMGPLERLRTALCELAFAQDAAVHDQLNAAIESAVAAGVTEHDAAIATATAAKATSDAIDVELEALLAEDQQDAADRNAIEAEIGEITATPAPLPELPPSHSETEFVDLKSQPPHLPRYSINGTFRNATPEEEDDCIKKLAELDGGTTNRATIRRWGRHWLRTFRNADTSQDSLEKRFNAPEHDSHRRPDGGAH